MNGDHGAPHQQRQSSQSPQHAQQQQQQAAQTQPQQQQQQPQQQTQLQTALPPDEQLRRVKVYELNEETGQWDDKGTGSVYCNYVEIKGGVCIVVYPEHSTEAKPLMQTLLSYEDIYRLQQDTLIVWNEPQSDLDYALSFQHAAGCDQIWREIKLLQTRTELPAVTMGTLDEVLQYISDAAPVLREKLVVALTQAGYVRKLLDLFAQCEDLYAEAELFTLFEIFKTLVLLNETLLLEQLFAPDVSLEVLGVFEYDAAVAPHNRVQHRQVVSAARAFREVVSLGNETLRQKVHQTHRMIYLKEVVLPRVLDENTMSSITSLVYFNQVEIVTHLRDDKRFVGELFHRLRTATDSEELQALVGLLQEFCALARNLQLKGRTIFYETLMRAGLYEATLRMLENPVRAVRLAVLDVLCGALAQNPAPWRQRAVTDPDETKLGDVLVEHLLNDTSGGVRGQCAEALRLMLHTEGGPVLLSSSYAGFGVDMMLGTSIENEPSFAHEDATSQGFYSFATSMDEDHSASSTSPLSPERRREQAHSAATGTAATTHRTPVTSSPNPSRMRASDGGGASAATPSSSPTDGLWQRQPPLPPGGAARPTPIGGEALYSQATAFLVRFYEQGLAVRLVDALKRFVPPDDAADNAADDTSATVPLAATTTAATATTTSTTTPADSAAPAPSFEVTDTVTTLIEMFGFCVQSHSFRVRSFAMKHDMVGTIARLCGSPTTHVALAAIRFMRLLVMAPDDFYVRRIQRHDLLRWMFQKFAANGPARNLLNSAVISLCSAIRELNNKPLVAYVVTRFAPLFSDIDYVDTFRVLQLKHEQNEESLQRAGGHLAASQQQQQQQQQSIADTIEDDYFESEAAAGAGAQAGSLDESSTESLDRKRPRPSIEFVPRTPTPDDDDDDDVAGAVGGFSSLIGSRPVKRRSPLTLKLKLATPPRSGDAADEQPDQQPQPPPPPPPPQ